jgi:hypothetical protein
MGLMSRGLVSHQKEGMFRSNHYMVVYPNNATSPLAATDLVVLLEEHWGLMLTRHLDSRREEATPLAACFYGGSDAWRLNFMQCVKFLLKAGADPTVTASDNELPPVLFTELLQQVKLHVCIYIKF